MSDLLPVELRAPTGLHPPLLAALAAHGLDALTGPRAGALVVLVHAGGHAPDAADDLVRDSRPHLAVGLAAHHLDLGPFVDPGLTACLRCLAASRPVPVATPAAIGPPTGLPDPSLLAVAAALLAHDVRRWAGGHEPATWSATLRVEASLAVSRREWLRHPQCGCAWSLPA